MQSAYKKRQDKDIESWSDPRYFFTTFVMPFGFLVWSGITVFFAIFPFYYIQRVISSDANQIATVVVFTIGFLAALYYTIAGFQIFFIELRKRCIAHKIIYGDGMFLLKGYYFKKATFHANEVKNVKPIIVNESIFQKRLGTLLSRSTRFTIPYGKNVNLKITLHDSRVFYLPGEMGRPGLWKTEDVKELRDFIEACVSPMPPTALRPSNTIP